MKQTQKVSLGLLLTFSLSINLAPSSVLLAAGSEIDLSTKIHPSNSIFFHTIRLHLTRMLYLLANTKINAMSIGQR